MAVYEALQLGLPGTPAVPDHYTAESTLLCPGAKRIVLQILEQAVIVQLGLAREGVPAGLGSIVWQAEDPWLPITAALARDFDAVRVKAFTPGVHGQIIVTAVGA